MSAAYTLVRLFSFTKCYATRLCAFCYTKKSYGRPAAAAADRRHTRHCAVHGVHVVKFTRDRANIRTKCVCMCVYVFVCFLCAQFPLLCRRPLRRRSRCYGVQTFRTAHGDRPRAIGDLSLNEVSTRAPPNGNDKTVYTEPDRTKRSDVDEGERTTMS